jgi:uncharacterized protein YcgI (DUF1989 family)
VADVNFWALGNPKERFYASKTRQLHASHLKAHDRCVGWLKLGSLAQLGAHSALPAPTLLLSITRLWSCFPYMRPLATITRETICYGIDKDGASVHDVIGSR